MRLKDWRKAAPATRSALTWAGVGTALVLLGVVVGDALALALACLALALALGIRLLDRLDAGPRPVRLSEGRLAPYHNSVERDSSGGGIGD